MRGAAANVPSMKHVEDLDRSSKVWQDCHSTLCIRSIVMCHERFWVSRVLHNPWSVSFCLVLLLWFFFFFFLKQSVSFCPLSVCPVGFCPVSLCPVSFCPRPLHSTVSVFHHWQDLYAPPCLQSTVSLFNLVYIPGSGLGLDLGLNTMD